MGTFKSSVKYFEIIFWSNFHSHTKMSVKSSKKRKAEDETDTLPKVRKVKFEKPTESPIKSPEKKKNKKDKKTKYEKPTESPVKSPEKKKEKKKNLEKNGKSKESDPKKKKLI